MLTQARRKKTGSRFIYDDITTVRLKRKFDLVVCFFDSVNHLNGITQVRKLFKTARLHLKDDGFFIFDMLTPDGLSDWDSVEIRREENFLVIVSGDYNPERYIADINIEGFVKTGRSDYRRFVQPITERTYPIEIVADALDRAGFKEISVTSFDSSESIKETSRWFFVVK
jgi:SAM-dependent methyltransferase